MAEVTYDGVGQPVGSGYGNENKSVSFGATAGALPDAEVEYDGQNQPVGQGYGNQTKSVSLGATSGLPPVNNPRIEEVDGPFDVATFDNKGKNVYLAPDPRAPVGTVLYKEVTFVSGNIINRD